MIRPRWRLVRLCAALMLLVPCTTYAGLQLMITIPLPGVRGQFGHMALDSVHHRLFVTVTGGDTMLALDLDTGAVTGGITGLDQPRDVVYLPQSKRLVVSNGGSGDAGFYAADTLTPINTITFGGDADALRFDVTAGRLYIAYGEGHGSGIAVADSDGRPLTQLPLDSHPEGFVVDASAKRIYVNLPASHEIAVFDLGSNHRIDTWSLGIESGANFPMALDAAHGRLFVATQEPDTLIVLDVHTGRVLQTLVAPGEAGDLFYNAVTGELYASGGVGKITVYTGAKAGRLLTGAEIRSLHGARTALLDAAAGRYYLAAPAGHGGLAEIRVYAITRPAAHGVIP